MIDLFIAYFLYATRTEIAVVTYSKRRLKTRNSINDNRCRATRLSVSPLSLSLSPTCPFV